MNCEDFFDRLQRRLDDRQRPDTDRELVRHTQQCDHCRGQLDAWLRVSSVMPPTSGSVGTLTDGDRTEVRSTPSRRVVLAICGLAAALMLVFVFSRQDQSRARTVAATNAVPAATNQVSTNRQQGQDKTLAQADPDVDPGTWWQQVQPREWVGNTMPTVRNVRDGVAPLGRTLMRAVTILTIGGSEVTS